MTPAFGAAYGLRIRSDFPLPELPPAVRGRTQVQVRLGPVRLPRRMKVEEAVAVRWISPREAFADYSGVGRFHARGGREIVVDPEPGADPLGIRRAVEGPVLGLLLQQRGFLLLHASAVLIRGSGVLFLGFSGMGKSSLAALAHARGLRVLCDEIAAVRVGPGVPRIFPGVPRAWLCVDSIRLLGPAPSRRPAFDEKFPYDLSRGFPTRAFPIRRIYLLASEPRRSVRPMSLPESFEELLRHSYYARFLPMGMRAERLPTYAALARKLPVRRLTRPANLSRLPKLLDLVAADAA